MPESDSVYADWRHLVETCRISGRRVHDARIAAAMRTNSIRQILTLNGRDFDSLPGIAVIDPLAF